MKIDTLVIYIKFFYKIRLEQKENNSYFCIFSHYQTKRNKIILEETVNLSKRKRILQMIQHLTICVFLILKTLAQSFKYNVFIANKSYQLESLVFFLLASYKSKSTQYSEKSKCCQASIVFCTSIWQFAFSFSFFDCC